MAIIKIDNNTWHYCLLGAIPIYIIKYNGNVYHIMRATCYTLNDVDANPFSCLRYATLKICEQVINDYIEVEAKRPKQTLLQKIKRFLGVEK